MRAYFISLKKPYNYYIKQNNYISIFRIIKERQHFQTLTAYINFIQQLEQLKVILNPEILQKAILNPQKTESIIEK